MRGQLTKHNAKKSNVSLFFGLLLKRTLTANFSLDFFFTCMVKAICSYYKIASGAVMLGCDNSSALSLAFEGDRPLSLHTPDFDVLYIIRHTSQYSVISDQLVTHSRQRTPG
jgi:hypothetical protein